MLDWKQTQHNVNITKIIYIVIMRNTLEIRISIEKEGKKIVIEISLRRFLNA